MKLEGEAQTKAKARRLRTEMTLPEVILWDALRRNARGFRFRRQHAAGPYIADFYCFSAKLIVEIDGEAHSGPQAAARDAGRDAWFASEGIATLRIPARDILADLDAVVRHIIHHCEQRSPSVTLRAPPPPGGEECIALNPPPRGEVAAAGGRRGPSSRRSDGGPLSP